MLKLTSKEIKSAAVGVGTMVALDRIDDRQRAKRLALITMGGAVAATIAAHTMRSKAAREATVNITSSVAAGALGSLVLKSLTDKHIFWTEKGAVR